MLKLKFKNVLALSLIGIGLIALRFFTGHFLVDQLFWILIILILFIGMTIWGVFDIRLNYFTKVYYKAQFPEKNQVSLTFDDGPTPYTIHILELLKKHRMKATFFCIGQQIEKYPEIAQEIINQGHLIANHSYTHSNYIGFSSLHKMEQEIALTDKVIKRVTNTESQFYRPPFGVTNPTIAKACKNKNKLIIGWNIRSLDTVIKDEEQILSRIVPKIKPGDIVLLHDKSERTVRVLEQLLIDLEEKKLVSVPVDYLLKKVRNV